MTEETPNNEALEEDGVITDEARNILVIYDDDTLLTVISNMIGKLGHQVMICRSKNGNPYTATMLEHCMATIYKNLGFDSEISGLHVLRRTFATRMYDNGAGVKEIAAYIGDLESTTMQYYIAARKKIKVGTTTKQFVPIPTNKKNITH